MVFAPLANLRLVNALQIEWGDKKLFQSENTIKENKYGRETCFRWLKLESFF